MYLCSHSQVASQRLRCLSLHPSLFLRVKNFFLHLLWNLTKGDVKQGVGRLNVKRTNLEYTSWTRKWASSFFMRDSIRNEVMLMRMIKSQVWSFFKSLKSLPVFLSKQIYNKFSSVLAKFQTIRREKLSMCGKFESENYANRRGNSEIENVSTS